MCDRVSIRHRCSIHPGGAQRRRGHNPSTVWQLLLLLHSSPAAAAAAAAEQAVTAVGAMGAAGPGETWPIVGLGRVQPGQRFYHG
jgi:hypothetical protein